jgi:flagellar hook-associated protein FlgK
MTSAFSDTFSTLNGSFAKMIDWNRSLMEKTLRTTQEESLRFINRRLERNARTLENLRNSQGLSGLIAAEQDWLVCAARDYAEGTEKFGGLLLELAANGARNVVEETRTAADTFRGATHETAAKTRRAAEHAERQAAE